MTSIEDLRFTPALLKKPPARGLAAETTLRHFAIVSYWVDESRLRELIHPRFEPLVLANEGGARRSLISVVTFLDHDFRFVAGPYFKGHFGQTNYRAYVRDTRTGEQALWFFGTCLDSSTFVADPSAARIFLSPRWFFGELQRLARPRDDHDGAITEARYPLLHHLGLVDEGELWNIHSVLLQQSIDFTVDLPPTRAA